MKLAVSLLGVVLAMSVPTVAVASHDPSGEPFDRDFVEGSGGLQDLYGYEFHVSSGPTGENATGSVLLQGRGGLLVGGEVTCLSVAGNRATIGFAGSFQPPIQGPAFGFFWVEDSRGEPVPPPVPGFPPAPADRFDYGSSAEVPQSCPPPTDANFEVTTPIGFRPTSEIVVHDATLPTSKEQCKNGGWRRYGSVFKNQGDCVTWVNNGDEGTP
jgi:hypothetical protein